MTRTHDLLITNQLHYRLCYTSRKSATLLLYRNSALLSTYFFEKIKKLFSHREARAFSPLKTNARQGVLKNVLRPKDGLFA